MGIFVESLTLTPTPMPDLLLRDAAQLIPPLLALPAASLLLRRRAPADPWTLAQIALGAAFLLLVVALPDLGGARLVMLPLVVVLGGLVFRFARRYLDGRPALHRWAGWYLLTLAGATLVVTTASLTVLALAWTLTSLALHHLLVFGDERPAAHLAAHKKFILSRLADAAILGAVLLITRALGSTQIPELLTRAAAMDALPGTLRLGVGLLALGVILRSAQLPFHGWLVQVMEAPTPVSALLHAGIVNLGAFVLILLAPLTGRVAEAQGLLVTAGAVSAVLGATVLLTRANVKTALAWSTCAQMGFVLIEIGLGAYDLALLHVAAHALYKAHAFLNSGARWSRPGTRQLTTPAPGLVEWAGAVGIAALVVGAALAVLHRGQVPDTASMASGAVLALALAPGLATWLASESLRFGDAMRIALGLPALYVVWHIVIAPVAPARGDVLVGVIGLCLLALAFLALFSLQVAIAVAPGHRALRALYPHASAGFHLDSLFTRLTFAVWPPVAPPRLRVAAPVPSTLRIERAA